MDIKITINCDNPAFGDSDDDKASELNRIFNVLIYKTINNGFIDRQIFDLNNSFVGLMEIEI